MKKYLPQVINGGDVSAVTKDIASLMVAIGMCSHVHLVAHPDGDAAPPVIH